MPHTLMLLWIALGLVAFWALLAVLRGLKQVAGARAKIASLVDQHLETLARRKLTLVKTDPYGIVDDAKWQKEFRYFVDKVVLPQLTSQERSAILFRREAVLQELVAAPVARRTRELEASLAMSKDMTPAEFEHWCSSAPLCGGMEGASHGRDRRSGRRCGRRQRRRDRRAAMQAA